MDAFKEQFSTTLGKDGSKEITPGQSSIIVAILSAGTVLGALMSAPLADSMGRRLSLIVGAVIFAIGSVFQVCSEHLPMLLVGR